YTINWFNISPELGLIINDFHLDPLAQGILESSFLIGAGIFQIPAGVASARWGPKNTSQLGMLVLSIGGLGEGLSPNFPTLVMTRLLLGIGAALFFAPAIGILTPLFKPEEEGLVLGLYNICFNIGGGLGLFVWVSVIEALDWHSGLILGGLLGLASVGIGQIVIPRDLAKTRDPRSMRRAFESRNVWIIGFGVLGLWGGIFTASQFLEYYLNTILSFPAALAGLLASLIMFASIFGGPIGGYISDKLRRRKIFILVPGILTSIGIGLFGASPANGLWFLIPAVGFLDAMVFSTMYASVSQYPEVGHEYAPLGISIINSVQILGSFGVTVGFRLYAAKYGFPVGWFFMGVLALLLMLLILMLREPFTANS
ncbi:MAG TPA: MFS transporter, partial [Candidatus Bathyarchaeia archaeon]|nr:MFS transporter [Candidatus Bathyarchaeia archaeon]